METAGQKQVKVAEALYESNRDLIAQHIKSTAQQADISETSAGLSLFMSMALAYLNDKKLTHDISTIPEIAIIMEQFTNGFCVSVLSRNIETVKAAEEAQKVVLQ